MVKRYGDVEALAGLSLSIGGGVWGLIGPNGAGKTTFIRLVLGLIRPTSGEVRAFGADCWKESLEVRSKVGILHERPSYPESMEVGRYLEIVARLYGVPNPEGAAAEALERVGLRGHSTRRISSLSAGMLKRLGLGQAIVHEPELVILDEPSANLDVLGRLKLMDLVREMAGEGVSFLISSHILPEVQSLCGHVTLIHRGRVLVSGSIHEILSEASRDAWVLEASDPEALAGELREMGYDANARGGAVHVRADSPTRLALDAASACLRSGVELRSLNPAVPSLEEAFRRLVGDEADPPR